MKKILITVLIIVVVAGLGYIIWIYFGSNTDPDNRDTINNPPPPDIMKKPRLTTRSNTPIFDYWINKTTGEIYYIEDTGQITKISRENDIESISTQKINDLISFNPSFNGEYILVSFGSLNNPVFSILNIEEDSWQPFPNNTISASWSPKENILALIQKNNSDSNINLFNPKAKKTNKIISLAIEDIELEWLHENEIYLNGRASSKSPSSILALDLGKKSLRFIINDEPGLMIKWSKNEDLGLKFTNSLKENNISLINKNGQLLRRANIGTTLPSKCDFDEKILYCAVPREIAGGIVLPDDYLKRKFYSEDTLISWDIEKNTTSYLFNEVGKTFDADMLNKQDDKLYFINRYDNKLYSLDLENN